MSRYEFDYDYDCSSNRHGCTGDCLWENMRRCRVEWIREAAFHTAAGSQDKSPTACSAKLDRRQEPALCIFSQNSTVSQLRLAADKIRICPPVNLGRRFQFVRYFYLTVLFFIYIQLLFVEFVTFWNSICISFFRIITGSFICLSSNSSVCKWSFICFVFISFVFVYEVKRFF